MEGMKEVRCMCIYFYFMKQKLGYLIEQTNEITFFF